MKIIIGLLAILTFCGCSQQSKDTAKQVISTGAKTEKYRLQYHFTPDSMWMNDPNGMVF